MFKYFAQKGINFLFFFFYSALRDRHHHIQQALQEYSTWQTLSPHEALREVNVIQHSLQSALESVDRMPNLLCVSKMTFEMPSFNVLSSMEHLGRLKMESRESQATCEGNIIPSTLQAGLTGVTEPPAKKRREA